MTNGNKKQELMDIVDALPPSKVVQLLEFAQRLRSPSKRDRKGVLKAAARIRGKYKDALSSSDEFAARKGDERLMEDR